MVRSSENRSREEALEEARACSDGATLPSGPNLVWESLNWLYAVTGHEANPSRWVDGDSSSRDCSNER